MTLLTQEGEQVVGWTRAEPFARFEREFERGSAQVREQDVQVVRIDTGLLRWPLEQELGVMDDVLVDRRTRGDEDRDARPGPPPGSTELLPGRRDRARIAGQDRRVESTDVDAELERVGRDDAEDLPVSQSSLDGSTLGGEIAAAIAPNAAPWPEALPERLAQPGQEQLDRDPRPAEHDGLAVGAQERQRPALGERDRRAARPARRVEQWRVHEQEVSLARRRPGPVDDPNRASGQCFGELTRVPDRG